MDEASESLADVRGWLCENLSEGDAGKVCGMLSVVSRHITALEDENDRLREQGARLFDKTLELGTENAKLRELIADVHEALRADKAGMFHKLILANMEDDMRELGIEGE